MSSKYDCAFSALSMYVLSIIMLMVLLNGVNMYMMDMKWMPEDVTMYSIAGAFVITGMWFMWCYNEDRSVMAPSATPGTKGGYY